MREELFLLEDDVIKKFMLDKFYKIMGKDTHWKPLIKIDRFRGTISFYGKGKKVRGGIMCSLLMANNNLHYLPYHWNVWLNRDLNFLIRAVTTCLKNLDHGIMKVEFRTKIGGNKFNEKYRVTTEILRKNKKQNKRPMLRNRNI